MYRTLIRPLLEYAAQVLTYEHYHLKRLPVAKASKSTNLLTKLELLQNKILKNVVPSPNSTPPALLRILIGIVQIEGRVDMLKMRYFLESLHGNVTTPNLSKVICEYYRKYPAKLGFVHEVFNICGKYNH